MGYLIGSRFVNTDKYYAGKKNAKIVPITVPQFKPVRGIDLSKSQDFKSRIRSQAADISRTAPTFNDPRYTFTTLSIPTDLRTLNGLYRFFDDTDPIVGNAVRLHTEFPLAGYGFSDCGDPGIKAHFEEMWDRIHGDQLLFDLGLEYWRIGNVFLFGAWNEVDYMWDQFAILNPDYVTVDSTWLNDKPLIKLQPDEALKRIVNTGQPKFLYDQLSPEIIKYVRLGQEIPLDPNNTFFIAHNKAPYEVLGKSIIKRLLKMMIYEDRLNMANFSIATRQVIPITVVKLGDPASVEEDHFVTYLEKDQLKIKTFKKLWDECDGIVTFCGEGKEVKDVSKYNFKTLSLKEDGTQVWNSIENILRHPTPDEVVEVTTPLSILRMTEGHSLVRINPDTVAFEHVTPKQLEERESPSIVSMDHYDYKVDADKVFNLPLTIDLAYLIGLWTADGSFCGDKNAANERVMRKTRIRISNLEENIGKYLSTLPYDVLKYISKNSDGSLRDTTYHIKFPELVKSLIDYYDVPYEDDSSNKTGKEKVPQEILFNSHKEIVGACFAGIFDGDGWINDDILTISCGSSKEYHHWLSLALLAQGILNCVRFRPGDNTGAWECQIRSKENRLKFYNLVFPYLKHRNKKLYIENHFKSVIARQEKTYVYDLGEGQKKVLFENSDYRSNKGDHPLTQTQRRKRVSRNSILKAGIDCEAKTVCQTLFGMSVTKIERKKKSSDYVYDLMLKDEPHTYLTAGSGWLVTFNSGWIPEQGEIEDVKEMFAAREIDPNFSVFYHYGIDVQFYGASGKILNVQPEMTRIIKLKFLGLGISEALLSGGTSTYATAYMNLEVLRQRYLHFQLRLENFVHKGLFEVVARLCGFYTTNKTTVGAYYKGKTYGDVNVLKEYEKQKYAKTTLRDIQDNEDFKNFVNIKAQESSENGLVVRPTYIYPKLKWDLLSLTSDAQYRQFLMAFDTKFPGVRKVSDATYYRVLKLDKNLEQRQVEVEEQEDRDRKLRKARKDREFNAKMLAEGLVPSPTEVKPGGGGAVTPVGVSSPQVPAAPGAPKAPVGKNEAEGEEKPGGGPEVLREESKEIQEALEEGKASKFELKKHSVASDIKKFGEELEEELDSDIKELKQSNEELLEDRDSEK